MTARKKKTPKPPGFVKPRPDDVPEPDPRTKTTKDFAPEWPTQVFEPFDVWRSAFRFDRPQHPRPWRPARVARSGASRRTLEDLERDPWEVVDADGAVVAQGIKTEGLARVIAFLPDLMGDFAPPVDVEKLRDDFERKSTELDTVVAELAAEKEEVEALKEANRQLGKEKADNETDRDNAESARDTLFRENVELRGENERLQALIDRALEAVQRARGKGE